MVILPNPCSINLPPKNNPFSMPGLASIIQTKSLDRFIINNNNNSVLQEWSTSRRGQFFTYQTSTTTRDVNEGKSGYSGKKDDHEALEKEIERGIGRLKAVVERVREMEIQKLMGRFKGTMSDEDILLVENMSRETVDKFLTRPVQYLKSFNGDNIQIQEKLKDLNLLIRMLEKSCLGCQR